MLGLSTELDAVNYLLRTIHERPVNSLDDIGIDDANEAYATLNEASRAVQSQGWNFNTEFNMKYLPEVHDSRIILPFNTLEADANGRTGHVFNRKVCVKEMDRRKYLYDLSAKTFIFKFPIYLDLILLLPFEEMPQAARDYIVAEASRIFSQRTTGSVVNDKFLEETMLRLRANMNNLEARTGDHNVLFGNPRTARTVFRDRYGRFHHV